MDSLEFSFICAKKFADLEGKDKIKRHCLTCNKEVINLDALTEVEQRELFEISSRALIGLCVSATVQTCITAGDCPQRYNTQMLVGESITPWEFDDLITEEEAESRMAELFATARKRQP